MQILQQSGKVPACAQAGLATAINGEDLLITGVSEFGSMSCVYAANGPDCGAQDATATKDWDSGRAMFESVSLTSRAHAELRAASRRREGVGHKWPPRARSSAHSQSRNPLTKTAERGVMIAPSREDHPRPPKTRSGPSQLEVVSIPRLVFVAS